MNIKTLLKSTIGLSYLNYFSKKYLRNHATILMMHRIVKEKEEAQLPHNNNLCIDQETFDNLIFFLKKHFNIVDLETALSMSKDTKPKITITFDDGWKDNISLAYPILKKHQIPATIFLSTNYIGQTQGFWWESISRKLWKNPHQIDQQSLQTYLDKYSLSINPALYKNEKTYAKSALILDFIHSLKQINPVQLNQLAETLFKDNEAHAMDWSDVKFLEDTGLVKFGPHGAQHYILTELDIDKCTEDIKSSQKSILENCKKPLNIYCYPNGNNNLEIQNLLKDLGYTHAVSTEDGLVSPEVNPYCLPRLNVCQKRAENPGLFAWAIFQGCRETIRSAKAQGSQ
ncbi:MAG: polysaccharide deacetylase family protein [Gammaproteobacteria bacterium]|nr:polysaccharide deacetylase family protein [Gammaproteobacteria bacterium]